MKKYLIIIWVLVAVIVLVAIVGFLFTQKGLTDQQINSIVISELSSYCTNLSIVDNNSCPGHGYVCWRLASDTMRVKNKTDLNPDNGISHHLYFTEKEGQNYLVTIQAYLAAGRGDRAGYLPGNITLNSQGRIISSNLPEHSCN